MITGDKFETAENIGFCSGIIPKDAKVFRFKNVSRSDFCQKVKLLKRQFQEENDEAQKAIVIDTSKISRYCSQQASFLARTFNRVWFLKMKSST
jgi:magnesium-transporting ATPase (P-type)